MYLMIDILSYMGKLLSRNAGTVPKGFIAKYSYFIVSTPISTTLKSTSTSPNNNKAKVAIDGDDNGLKYKVIY